MLGEVLVWGKRGMRAEYDRKRFTRDNEKEMG
jgi:hypothetical protein